MPPPHHRHESKEGDADDDALDLSATNLFLGTQAIFGPKWEKYRIPPFAGHGYDEPGMDMLTELRTAVKAMGSNIFKWKIGPNVVDTYQLSVEAKPTNLMELCQVPAVANTLGDPDLLIYPLWTYSFAHPKPLQKDWTEEALEVEYQEIYDLSAHLLTTYAQTGKAFLLGNWEGDWELMWASGCRCNGKFDFHTAPTEEVVNRYIQLAQTRQRAVDQAKQDVGCEGVDLFFYLEFNLENENYKSDPCNEDNCRPTMLNSVVPHVNPDFLSYSSYKSTNNYMKHRGKWCNVDKVHEKFWKLLDYAESKLQDKPSTDFSRLLRNRDQKRVFVGEFGAMRACDPALFVPSVAHVVRASLTWGCPLVLYWEVYDNDSETEPLVPRDSSNVQEDLSPLRQLFRDWAAAAQAHHEKHPKWGLRKFAIQWFQKVIERPVELTTGDEEGEVCGCE